ncbi:hypothetical protein GGR50DRAFT_36034 [Xylaria sp. CBS 124048]|nr:hypothetical protein GGR50DRAFT_36034 [Xylaria sp. CBS 124048]
MPTYLCHGFRWHRKSIRYFIVRYDIGDAATEWVVAPRSEAALIDQFYSLYSFLPPAKPTPSPAARRHRHAPSVDSYLSRASSSEGHASEDPTRPNRNSTTVRGSGGPRQSSKSLSQSRAGGPDGISRSPRFPYFPMSSTSSPTSQKANRIEWPTIKLLEEFDPTDESVVSGPWAYVADYVVRVDTSVSIADEMHRYETRMKRDPDKAMNGPSDEYGRKIFGASTKKTGWLEKLRDQLQRGESIRWYVVVCGDEERSTAADYGGEEELLEEDEDAYEEEGCEGSSARSQWLRQSQSTQSTEATTTTNPSVIEDGFEYRIPELVGLARGTPRVVPERKQNKLLGPLLPRKEPTVVLPPPSPSKSPISPEFVNKPDQESIVHPTPARSSIGLRKLFFRRKSEESG